MDKEFRVYRDSDIYNNNFISIVRINGRDKIRIRYMKLYPDNTSEIINNYCLEFIHLHEFERQCTRVC